MARADEAYRFRRRRGTEAAETFEQVIDDQLDASRCLHRLGLLRRSPRASSGRTRVESVHALILEEFVRDPKTAVVALLDQLGFDSSPLPTAVLRDNAGRAGHSERLSWARRQHAMRTLVRQLPAGAHAAGRKQTDG